MRCRADIVTVICVCLMVLDRQASTEKLATAPCSPQKMTALSRKQLSSSLISFDKANGKHLGNWSPGFPELHVHYDEPLLASRVQCKLLFIVGGLQEILEDQRKNLNPEDFGLHLKLKDAILTINTLSHCLKEVLGGECQSRPNLPKMPLYAFARKQWSHTLLEEAKTYLGWLHDKTKSQNIKYKVKNTFKYMKAMHVRYLEVSGYKV